MSTGQDMPCLIVRQPQVLGCQCSKSIAASTARPQGACAFQSMGNMQTQLNCLIAVPLA